MSVTGPIQSHYHEERHNLGPAFYRSDDIHVLYA